MFLLQEIPKRMNAPHIADIKRLELDRRVAAVLHQHLCSFECGVVVQFLDCFGTPFCGTSSEVDEEGSGAKWGGGILQGEVADCLGLVSGDDELGRWGYRWRNRCLCLRLSRRRFLIELPS